MIDLGHVRIPEGGVGEGVLGILDDRLLEQGDGILVVRCPHLSKGFDSAPIEFVGPGNFRPLFPRRRFLTRNQPTLDGLGDTGGYFALELKRILPRPVEGLRPKHGVIR